jgi:carboxylesterase
MRLLGEYLNQRGLAVSAPLLPGHGTTVEDMNRSRWTDWTGHVEQALLELEEQCQTVFVCGLSMGAALTLYLAASRPEFPGIVLYSPAVWPANRLYYLTPLLKYLIPRIAKAGGSSMVDPEADLRVWSYNYNPTVAAHEFLKLLLRVRRSLPRVTSPLLVIYSTRDPAIHPKSAPKTFERAGSHDKELVIIQNSGHVITVDGEWEGVAERTYRFIADHLPEGVRLEG